MVGDGFFPGERTRAWVGVILYVIAGVLGSLLAPALALAIFVAMPIVYAITSEGLYQLPTLARPSRAR